ncbi:NUDIX domain-containing protein [Actinospica sp. MGRD01-02]|uniref:NUDIX domain-containing protein n=1 Tax=Actinospica acidithermotolerans TaxID=2828514 RepID=A0A941EAI0_9ACTN|nr:NUDIX domain-containing protein [Actinospica acidithermotolerans]MBR7825504.1 NUDIX domain-containing protein [Actinospica acidithermotolerans]
MSDAKVWKNRIAGRVILLNDEDRVLLFEGFDPAEPDAPWWFTPGGGVEPDETPREAAARELFEETGLTVAPDDLGEQVYQDYVEFSFDGVALHQHNHFFALRTSASDITTTGFDEMEQRTHLGHRWWSADELAASSVTYFPEELAELLGRLVDTQQTEPAESVERAEFA